MEKLLFFLGKKVLNFISEFGQIVNLLVGVIKYIPRIIKDRRLVLDQMALVGSDSLPLVLLIGIFTGAIAALEATMLFSKFNLLEMTRPYLGASIGTAVFTELTPVLIALVIAGRVGGAMAAQIGTMNVSEQIDALEIMAIDKVRYLAMPRVVASVFMLPVLAIFSNIVALIGGYILVAIRYDFTLFDYFDSIKNYFSSSEIIVSLSKSCIFGGVTALIGCHIGFRTSGGAEGVGNSTVRAFTISAASILIIDALFGYLAKL